jgi:hypothetical protein
VLSRRWKQRKNVQNVSLIIVDDTHTIGGDKVGRCSLFFYFFKKLPFLCLGSTRL